MYLKDGELRFSPTDLINYLEGDFASWMDRWYLHQKTATQGKGVAATPLAYAPDPDDPTLRIVADLGIEHERRFLEKIAQNNAVFDVERGDGATATTLQAMKDGIPVVYQGELVADRFGGYADFLFKVEGESALGSHHYEPWDTKLARSVKPYFIIQLCAYADLLEQLQGRRPCSFAVVLGNGEEKRYATHQYFYYYRQLRAAFLKFQDAFDAADMPQPGLSRGYGRWTNVAATILSASDHLSGVARCTRRQVKLLEAAGVATIAALAEMNGEAIVGISPPILTRLQQQARLQVQSRGQARPAFDVVVPSPDDPRRGLALLPPPSPGDVYFDMEGHPLVEGGLEYLFGAVTVDGGGVSFVDWWAHNAIQEKAAFESFIDWVHERWQADPGMHIYHYAAYEPAAMRRLMGKYATREREVDDLLRHQVFVDLYAIVRQGVLVGTPSYSLKDVERIYMPPRSGDVTTAGGSMVFYQNWIDARESEDWRQSPILRSIRDYNRDDCVSTCELAGWLRGQQQVKGIGYLPPPAKPDDDEADADPAAVSPATELASQLLNQVAAIAMTDPERAQVQELIAWLLEFHWREAKPVFWRMFDRQAMTEDELIADLDCLGGLQRTRKPATPIRQSMLYEYSYDPDQDTKLEEGSNCFIAQDLSRARIERLDVEAGIVGIAIGPGKPAPPARLSLIPDEYVSAKPIADAVLRFADGWMRNEKSGTAVDDLLFRRLPRIRGRLATGTLTPLIEADAELLPDVIQLVRSMDSTTLCIQGPPGSGKTYTAAHIIAELLRDGRGVGVMANSHKAILNLLRAVVEACRSRGVNGRVVKVGGDGDDPMIDSGEIEHLATNGEAAGELNNGPAVLGGTAWLFSRPELEDRFDFLFVDEAGQVSLANIVGTGGCATNLILVGDQMQLSHPIQGSHPGESGQSALDYLLQGRPTIPPELGVFLGISWRMHPDVCRFISAAVYEGRLHSHDSAAGQAVLCEQRNSRIIRRATGVVFVPVPHEDNTQASDEEVELIDQIVKDLLGRCIVARDGRRRALTLADILIVAPYNMQVRRLRRRLGPDARVGSVDKFQGQEAAVVIVSMCTSSIEDSPRGVEFLLNKNRMNVALSRAQCLSIVVGCPELMAARCRSVAQMELVNLFCWMADYAEKLG